MILVRWGAPVVLALIINASLYVMMESMTSRPQGPRLLASQPQAVDFLRVPEPEQTRVRDRARQPPPEPETVQRLQIRMDTAVTDLPARLPLDVAAISISSLLAQSAGGLGVPFAERSGGDGEPSIIDVRSLTPIAMMPPQYPRQALIDGTEGWVVVLFRVDERGGTRDARVEEAQPPGVFDQAALAAVARWRFRTTARDPDAPPLYARARIDFVREWAADGP